MMCYKDMTFCADACDNMKCKRNKKHVPNDTHGSPVAWSHLKDTCSKYNNPEFGDSVEYKGGKR